jgi:hypothetical protein
MSAHTPGPWVYGDWMRRAEGVYDGAGWVEVWSKSDPDNCFPIIACKHHDELANARLIAEAPNLLFQLLAAANYIDALGGDSKSYRGAIAKAGGAA